MDSLQVIFLALIQGITEFLPISSSAHLILPAQLLDWKDQGLAFDIAVHMGSLIAVVTYFRHELKAYTIAWLGSLNGKNTNQEDARVAWAVLYATLPALLAGWFISDYTNQLRHTLVIAATTILFGLLLWFADSRARKSSQALATLSVKQALFIGMMQCLALIPGTSRSGITMTAALMAGLDRKSSATFSFLLSIPVILAAGTFKWVQLVTSESPVDWLPIMMGACLSAISAYLCIHLFLDWINRLGFLPFVIYRLVLGIILILFFYLS